MENLKPLQPSGVEVYSPDARYSGGYVCFQGGPPCVIIDTWEQEAQIRSILDGQEYVVAKGDLIDAEVNIAVRGMSEKTQQEIDEELRRKYPPHEQGEGDSHNWLAPGYCPICQFENAPPMTPWNGADYKPKVICLAGCEEH